MERRGPGMLCTLLVAALLAACGGSDDETEISNPLQSVLTTSGATITLSGTWSTGCVDTGGGLYELTTLVFASTSSGTYSSADYNMAGCTSGLIESESGSFSFADGGTRTMGWDAGDPAGLNPTYPMTLFIATLTITGLGTGTDKGVAIVDDETGPSNRLFGTFARDAVEDGLPLAADGYPLNNASTEPLIDQ